MDLINASTFFWLLVPAGILAMISATSEAPSEVGDAAHRALASLKSCAAWALFRLMVYSIIRFWHSLAQSQISGTSISW